MKKPITIVEIMMVALLVIFCGYTDATPGQPCCYSLQCLPTIGEVCNGASWVPGGCKLVGGAFLEESEQLLDHASKGSKKKKHSALRSSNQHQVGGVGTGVCDPMEKVLYHI